MRSYHRALRSPPYWVLPSHHATRATTRTTQLFLLWYCVTSCLSTASYISLPCLLHSSPRIQHRRGRSKETQVSMVGYGVRSNLERGKFYMADAFVMGVFYRWHFLRSIHLYLYFLSILATTFLSLLLASLIACLLGYTEPTPSLSFWDSFLTLRLNLIRKANKVL